MSIHTLTVEDQIAMIDEEILSEPTNYDSRWVEVIRCYREILVSLQNWDSPRPLTLGELQVRVGKPVWLEFESSRCSLSEPPEWKILKRCNPTRFDPYIDFGDVRLCARYYGEGWLAYDHPPKRVFVENVPKQLQKLEVISNGKDA